MYRTVKNEQYRYLPYSYVALRRTAYCIQFIFFDMPFHPESATAKDNDPRSRRSFPSFGSLRRKQQAGFGTPFPILRAKTGINKHQDAPNFLYNSGPTPFYLRLLGDSPMLLRPIKQRVTLCLFIVHRTHPFQNSAASILAELLVYRFTFSGVSSV